MKIAVSTFLVVSVSLVGVAVAQAQKPPKGTKPPSSGAPSGSGSGGSARPDLGPKVPVSCPELEDSDLKCGSIGRQPATSPAPRTQVPLASPPPAPGGGSLCTLKSGTRVVVNSPAMSQSLKCYVNEGNNICYEASSYARAKSWFHGASHNQPPSQTASNCSGITGDGLIRCLINGTRRALLGNGGVCRDYAYYFGLAAAAAGLECDYRASNKHAWNACEGSGCTYIIDAFSSGGIVYCE